MRHWKGTVGLNFAFRAILKIIHSEFPLYFILFPSFVYVDKEMDSGNKELKKIHANLKYKITITELTARNYCFFVLEFVQKKRETIAFSSWSLFRSSNHTIHEVMLFVFE